jgi:RecJ-like exonuclease
MNNELQVNKNYYESDYSPTDCPRCRGNGYNVITGVECSKCSGTGRYMAEGTRHTMGTHMDKTERNNSDVIKWLFQW